VFARACVYWDVYCVYHVCVFILDVCITRAYVRVLELGLARVYVYCVRAISRERIARACLRVVYCARVCMCVCVLWVCVLRR
jgi:hypothetical protein